MQDTMLARFFVVASSDERIHPTHILLYAALYHCREQNHFETPFSVSRSQLMKLAKIRGKTTYHKHIKELNMYGYIRYEPSYHPRIGSLVYFNELQPEKETGSAGAQPCQR